MSIYVETHIAGTIDDLLEKTQRPDLHERWDLRFTHIDYLPRPDEAEPQRFLYQTRIGLGIAIAGRGEAAGTRVSNTHHTAALKFWSDDPRSLILRGSGYWNYEQHSDFVRFRTRYNYQTRFGLPGQLFDRFVFRPLLGWATAWSFDRLRLWIEKGIDPSVSTTNSVVHALARLTLAFIWLYHGLIPKLLVMHPDELLPLTNAGISEQFAALGVIAAGVAEICFGLVLLVFWMSRRLLLINIPIMLFALVGVGLTAPELLTAAFNPVTLNLSVIVLSLVAYIVSAELPSASRCLRKEPMK
jgi:uncharacterized membrane protein YphA (DoxX/SURF4 family)